VVTYNGHGLETGDVVSFSGIVQANWTALNGNSYVVTKINANTFSIPVDTTTFGAYSDVTGKVYQDYVGSVHFPNGLRVTAFDFLGSQANDVLVVRRNTATGQIVHKRVDTGGGGYQNEVAADLPQKIKPYIQMAECTIGGTVADALITIQFA